MVSVGPTSMLLYGVVGLLVVWVGRLGIPLAAALWWEVLRGVLRGVILELVWLKVAGRSRMGLVGLVGARRGGVTIKALELTWARRRGLMG